MTSPVVITPSALASLPNELPVFPVSGAILLPHARLPLNIFEPRHMAMVEEALGKGRILGMIQPSVVTDSPNPPLYSVGCAGKIVSFTEADDGHFIVVLKGLCRFAVKKEVPNARLFRTVEPDWEPYLSDVSTVDDTGRVDRDRLIQLMRIFFKKNGISVDWNIVKNAPDDVLVPTIIMICPFPANEKQALLEAKSFVERADMLLALLEMAAMPQSEKETELRH